MIKEIDVEGLTTLTVIEKADRFNNWMYTTIAPHCTGKILEIGSGIGNISQFFIKNNQDITLSDLRDNYCEILKQKFSNDVIKVDLVHPNFEEEYKDLLATFDTVFALNVVEHIKDDVQAIANCKRLLKQNGTLLILVPAYQFLFNNFDVELEHFRRYTQKGLKSIIQKNNLTTIKEFSFNFIGIFGWYFSGNILKKKTIPEGQMGFFNLFVPIFKLADFVTFRKIGLSVINVSVKKES
ncbi:putative methyltransferase [Flavobacterium cauense R2A-7]|uniref:Methyltransferase family protein n=1 Tax=Flavobacterium cauense R2A-7 TaxID=1341154 RepID=V6S5M7_9FLAO|nr:class I SAM-dependent methyltransferase [Flavobacterium cauense]ESU22003.1 putative methyltransferase [Flavobacterium cauense R2A-7]KGO81331.1 methyltransferase type 12 [Flavobacterium cauense R2A-7]TWI13219.1 methyltransferase family protein [Flavobacterium cauense R2A-7]